MVRHGERLGEALALVVAGARPHRIHIAPIGLYLQIHQRVSLSRYRILLSASELSNQPLSEARIVPVMRTVELSPVRTSNSSRAHLDLKVDRAGDLQITGKVSLRGASGGGDVQKTKQQDESHGEPAA